MKRKIKLVKELSLKLENQLFSSRSDSWFWNGDPKGIFSVASTYGILCLQGPTPTTKLYKQL